MSNSNARPFQLSSREECLCQTIARILRRLMVEAEAAADALPDDEALTIYVPNPIAVRTHQEVLEPHGIHSSAIH